MTQNPFRYFKTSREVIQLAVMMYVRFPLSLRKVEDLLHERGIDVCHESIRLWVDRFGRHCQLNRLRVSISKAARFYYTINSRHSASDASRIALKRVLLSRCR